jgi:hypothetical protein
MEPTSLLVSLIYIVNIIFCTHPECFSKLNSLKETVRRLPLSYPSFKPYKIEQVQPVYVTTLSTLLTIPLAMLRKVCFSSGLNPNSTLATVFFMIGSVNLGC